MDVVSPAPSGSGSTAFLTGSPVVGGVEPGDVDFPGAASPGDVAASWEAWAAFGPSVDVDGPGAAGSHTARVQAKRSLRRPDEGPLRKYPVS